MPSVLSIVIKIYIYIGLDVMCMCESVGVHQSADYIFYFLWDHCTHSGYFENRTTLKTVLGGLRRFANYIAAYETTI